MIGIVHYGTGNVGSVAKAVDYLGYEPLISDNPKDLRRASHIILPGVGSFFKGMQNLRDLGFVTALEDEVVVKKKPFLGICLGMQLIASMGEEAGPTKGLGWIDADVVRFQIPTSDNLKVPHVGWNDVEFLRDDSLFNKINNRSSYYFVHSYHMRIRDPLVLAAVTNYGENFPSVIIKDHICATQFHPEKSQEPGLKLLENFLRR